MKMRTIGALCGLAGAALLTPWSPASAAGLGEAMELEHARANARAGGPVSARDRELLERYGCLSGTNSPVCRQGGYRYEEPPRRKWTRYKKRR